MKVSSGNILWFNSLDKGNINNFSKRNITSKKTTAETIVITNSFIKKS